VKTLLTGNSAASWGAKLSRVQVIAAYPITPQTSIVEELSKMCAEGVLDARFIMVESEHSALACVMGAQAAGARAFTATSSQGLLLMHEILHWVAGARLPIVMVNVNRAVAPGWNIWADQTDSLSQRDTGWAQVHCSSPQEALDFILVSYRVAEEYRIPIMVCYDAFYISHTQEVVDLPSQERADEFLGPSRFTGYIDFDNPRGIGSLTMPEDYVQFRESLHRSLISSIEGFEKSFEHFAEAFGRKYAPVEVLKPGNGILLVTSGSLAGNLETAVEILAEKGIPTTLADLKLIRPLASHRLEELAKEAETIIVIERNISPGGKGILCSEISSACSRALAGKNLVNLIAGIGGLDVTPDDIVRVVERIVKSERTENVLFLHEMLKEAS